MYSDDLPSLPHEVFASFVLSTVAVGEIISIDPTKALVGLTSALSFFLTHEG